MKPEQIKGHLYALKVLAVMFAVGAIFVAAVLAAVLYEPISKLVIWMIITFFGVFTFANIYSVLYEIGKEK